MNMDPPFPGKGAIDSDIQHEIDRCCTNVFGFNEMLDRPPGYHESPLSILAASYAKIDSIRHELLSFE